MYYNVIQSFFHQNLFYFDFATKKSQKHWNEKYQEVKDFIGKTNI